jgi:hypothetical protein
LGGFCTKLETRVVSLTVMLPVWRRMNVSEMVVCGGLNLGVSDC